MSSQEQLLNAIERCRDMVDDLARSLAISAAILRGRIADGDELEEDFATAGDEDEDGQAEEADLGNYLGVGPRGQSW